MENDLEKLSLLAHVKINNTFTFFYATPETRKWTVKAEHCTWRGVEFEVTGYVLADLIKEALQKIETYGTAKSATAKLERELDEAKAEAR